MKDETKVDFEHVASKFMFIRDMTISEIVKAERLEYRKGKDSEDVKKAYQKALKKGQYKTETELGMFEIYLKDVFKARKVKDESEQS